MKKVKIIVLKDEELAVEYGVEGLSAYHMMREADYD